MTFEQKILRIDLMDSIGYVFEFPLRVFPLEGGRSRQSYVSKIGLFENPKTGDQLTFADLYRFMGLPVMEDMIHYYKDKSTLEANWFNKNFVEKYYNPMEPLEAFVKFKNLAWFDFEELNELANYYTSYTIEYEKVWEKISEEFSLEKKEIEKISKEEREQKRKEALERKEQRIAEAKIDLFKKYEGCL
ncbi:MAG TPA: hypothetical protein V6C96_02015 [Vampirovibrionales bacterium]